MHVNKINLIHNNSIKPIFKGEFEDRVQRLRSDYNAVTWWMYGEDDSKELVEKNMRNEIYDLERDVARKQVERDSLSRSLQDLKSHHNSMLSSKRSRISTLESQKSGNNSTIRSLERTLSDLGSTLSSLKSSNDGYRTTISKQEAIKQDLIKKNKEIQESQKTHENNVQKDLEIKLAKMQASQEQKLNELELQLENSIRTPNQMKREMNCPTLEGFGAIAGYNEEKEQLKTIYGQAVVLERYGKVAEVPNGILLYGPDSDFNDNFASRIAKQYNVNFIEAEHIEDQAERLKNLRNIAAKSQEEYKNTGKRTIIFIKDFECFAPKGSRIIGPLKSFMDKLSIESHATVVATSQHPELLDDILLRTSRFQLKLPIPPVNESNLVALVKSTLDSDTLIKINIPSIVKRILALQVEGGFSIKTLQNIIKNIIPDIDKKSLELFEKQVKLMKQL
jgi:SpoVK/Ycf46/Vps4 family AAA+-type ATPase